LRTTCLTSTTGLLRSFWLSWSACSTNAVLNGKTYQKRLNAGRCYQTSETGVVCSCW
jgi:hypothetical protein